MEILTHMVIESGGVWVWSGCGPELQRLVPTPLTRKQAGKAGPSLPAVLMANARDANEAHMTVMYGAPKYNNYIVELL